MKFLRILNCLIIVSVVQFCGICNGSPETGPLFLTPLIKGGKISEALKLSEVSYPSHEQVDVPEAQWPKSYSGFMTVNEEFGTNLFFWYFPAKNNSETAPVLFWSDGGPGATLLHCLLNLHGPFKFNQERKLVLRNDNASLHSEFNVIYLDNPAGVGYSFTKEEAGYAKSGRETGPNIYEFLTQFFRLFPHLRKNDFYNGGGSYGGTYATVIAHYIHEQNQKLQSLQKTDQTESELAEKLINLKGIMMDSPWIHPQDQVDYGTWLYSSGLISRASKTHFDTKRDEMIKLIKEDKFTEAATIWISVALMDIITHTGLPSLYDYVDQDLDHIALIQYNYTDLFTSSQFRKSLHVGASQNFYMFNPQVQGRMMGHFMNSVKDLLEQLLDSEGGKFRVLIIAGDHDLITGHGGIQEVTLGLEWSGGEDFRKGEKQAWMDGHTNRFAGNIQTSPKGQLTYALVQNAGHGAAIHQPVKVVELMKGFVRGEIGDGDEEGEDFTNYFPNDGEKLKGLREDL